MAGNSAADDDSVNKSVDNHYTTPDGVRRIERRLRPRDEKVLSDEKVGALYQLNTSGGSVWVPGPQDTRFALEAETLAQILDRFCSEGLGDARPPTVVVIVAHPDDEAIGAGARLKGLPDVYVVHVTDGAPANLEYVHRRGFSTRDEYATVRRREVVAALSLAGIDEDRILGMNIIDGEASMQLVELSYAMADLIEELQPEIVLTHPYEGGHSDHDATAFAVHLACGILRRDGASAPVVLELTSYHNFGGEKRVGEFLPYNEAGTGTGAIGRVEERTVGLTPDLKKLKREMYNQFESQQALLSTFPVKSEKFRPAPRYVFTVPPHPGTLNYERACATITGEEWRAKANSALEVLRAKRRARAG